MSLTYLGHSAFKFSLPGACLYTDPYFQDPVDWSRLEKGDVVLLSHGHFDHGVLLTPRLYEAWKCQFVGPRRLVQWMTRKYRRRIPSEAFIALDAGESTRVCGIKVAAIPALHPLTRLGKTILTLFARSSAPGNPVNGYYFDRYYHAGDTIYSPAIAESLKGKPVETACIPIGGKYKVASPAEAIRIAEEINASRLVPMHWQPLVEQVPFRYKPSDLLRLAATARTKVTIHPLAVGEVLEELESASRELRDGTRD